jgi:YD repeat-containing protein
MTVDFNYNNSAPFGIATLTNNLGRTLTFNYTGNYLSTITDGESRTVTYSVNTTTNLLTSISDPLTNVTTFGYNSANLFYQYFKPQNPSNAYVTNTYDSLNRVSSQKDIYGNTYTFYFAGSRSAFVDPASNTEIQYYDSEGNLIQDIDELGNITSYVRDGRGRITLLTYPEGNTEAYTYDNYNDVLSVTYAAKPGSGLANIVNSFTYDPTYNKVHTAVDGKLQTTTYNYDPATGNLLTVKKPAVNGFVPTITKAYNSYGQVISSIDETGIQTQNNYSTTNEELLSTVVNTNAQATIGGTVKVGDILTITAHDTLLGGGEEAVSYTVKTGDTLTSIAAGLAAAVNADTNLAAVNIVAYSNAAVISLATAKGNTTTFTESVSTGATETIAIAVGLKITTTFGYDSVGNVHTIKDPLSNTTTLVSDKSRRLTTRTEATPFSYVTMYGYDKNNNLTSVERQTGNTMTPEQTYTIAYTLSDKVYTVTDPATNVTTKTYDNFDRLWTVTDAQSKKTTFAYDQRSKLHTVTDSSNTVSETRTYTNNGKLYQLSDARSNITTYSYDGFDRANKTVYADSSFEQNSSYDANNNVLTQLTRSGASITNTYDPLNRLSTKAPTGQATVTYLYDLSGRLLSATTPVVSGNPATGAFSFAHDTAGRLIQEETPDSKTVKYGLDKNSNLTKLTYPDGYYVTRVYDQLNRLTTIELDGSTTAAIGITYDELSRRMVLTYDNGATSTYGFQLNDDLTTLAEAFVGSSVTLTYGFNKVHQETSRAVTDGTYLWHPGAGGTTTYAAANSVNEYPTVGSASFQYDGNGNLKSDGIWTYVYDSAP